MAKEVASKFSCPRVTTAAILPIIKTWAVLVTAMEALPALAARHARRLGGVTEVT